MALFRNLERTDRWLIGILLFLVPVAVLVDLALEEAGFAYTIHPLLGILEVVAFGILFYAGYRGLNRWSGRLSRNLTVLLIALGIVFVGELLDLAVAMFLDPTGGTVLGHDARFWYHVASGLALAGFIFGAYGFTLFRNAPWFPRQETDMEWDEEGDDG